MLEQMHEVSENVPGNWPCILHNRKISKKVDTEQAALASALRSLAAASASGLVSLFINSILKLFKQLSTMQLRNSVYNF